MGRVFLYKDRSEDRDCCVYTEDKPLRFQCNHYFGRPILEGACFCGREYPDFEEIQTALSRAEYEQFIHFGDEIGKLGYGIERGDDRFKAGVELCKNIQPVYDKLNSEKNKRLFRKVQKQEKEWLMAEYELSEDDIEKIFGEYALEYRDRGIVGYVFDNTEDLGYEEAHSLGYVQKDNFVQERYFDFEKFGEDLAEDENHVLLDDGRVVSLNY